MFSNVNAYHIEPGAFQYKESRQDKMEMGTQTLEGQSAGTFTIEREEGGQEGELK